MKIRLAMILAVLLLLGLILIQPAEPEEKESSSSMLLRTQLQTVTTVASSTAPPTQPSTQPSTQTTAAPETHAPTTVPTKPATKPSATTSTAQPEKTNTKVLAFEQERMNSWICPVKDEFGEVTGSRRFASSRGGGKRAHAGLDFVAPHGTKVYAITSGTVQRVALFYQNTSAVEVLNDDGSILRYCEIATKLEVGDKVAQGDVIGTILRANSGTEMLHMEVYYGDGEGMLTQTGNKQYTYVENKNFMRRSDLMDPTFLKDLKKG